MGWESEFVIAQLVIIEGNPDGVFVYDGTPAAGTLIVSIAAQAGTDQYGNTYPKGIQVSGGGANVLVLNPSIPQLEINPDTTTLLKGTIKGSGGSGIAGRIEITSPQQQVGAPGISRLVVASAPSAGGDAIISSVADSYSFACTNATITITADAQIQASTVIKTGATWQTPTYNANWSGSTTFNTIGVSTLRYRIDAEDNLWLVGAFKTGAVAGGTAVFALAGAFIPAAVGDIPLYRNNAATVTAGMLHIATSGNVDLFPQLNGGIAANNEYLVNGKIPLGNIT